MVFNKLNWFYNIKLNSIPKYWQKYKYNIFVYNGYYILPKLHNFDDSTLKVKISGLLSIDYKRCN